MNDASRTIICGLGNPGETYANTRHNIGFDFVEYVQQQWHFPEFSFDKKFNGDISEGGHDGKKYILLKPQTFMNNSGDSVRALMDYYKIFPENVVLVHDELDLPTGTYKIATDSRAAGHNGVSDVFEKLGTQQIRRARIGIVTTTPDGVNVCSLMGAHNYVLAKMGPEEKKEIEKLFPKIVEELF